VDNELSEACLNTLQSITKRCPREVSPYVQNLFQDAMKLVIYDPNYIYDDNDEDMAEEDEGDWGSDFDDGDIGGMDDDDDTSWKVRRGAVSVMDAIIKTRPEFHRTIFEKYSNGIVRRFRERVDDVKIELMETYNHLLIGSTENLNVPSIDLELKNQTSLKQ